MGIFSGQANPTESLRQVTGVGGWRRYSRPPRLRTPSHTVSGTRSQWNCCLPVCHSSGSPCCWVTPAHGLLKNITARGFVLDRRSWSQDVVRTWSTDVLIQAETKGTCGVHG